MSAAKKLRRALEVMRDEGGDLVRIYLIDRAEGRRIADAASDGDQRSLEMLRALSDWAAQIQAGIEKKPVLCLCCPHPIRSIHGVSCVLAIPEHSSPTVSVASALCPSCAVSTNVTHRALDALRDIWPNLRRLDVLQQAGHA